MPKSKSSSQRHPSGPAAPTPSRPHMPGYGIGDAASGSGLMPWSRVNEQMSRSRNYWIGTTRPDGRPHAMPVWGIWLDGTFYFGTDRRSQKARNLAANPALGVHLESGDEAVILEGVAEDVTDSSLLARIDDAYNAKYGIRGITTNDDASFYGLQPRVAFAWREKDFPSSATRWRFGDD